MPALGTSTGIILDHGTSALDCNVMEVPSRIPVDRREQARQMLETVNPLAEKPAS